MFKKFTIAATSILLASVTAITVISTSTATLKSKNDIQISCAETTIAASTSYIKRNSKVLAAEDDLSKDKTENISEVSDKNKTTAKSSTTKAQTTSQVASKPNTSTPTTVKQSSTKASTTKSSTTKKVTTTTIEWIDEATTATSKASTTKKTTQQSTTSSSAKALYTASQFKNAGVVYWGNYRWTWYSQKVLPGPGLNIPGRHVDENGYVCDVNNYICLASSTLAKGTVVSTPFGKAGKVYDSGCAAGTLDVYTNF